MNKVELIGCYGGDVTHAMSAWTSTDRAREATTEELERLIQVLAKDGHSIGHGTPFEKSFLHFLVTTDIATHIHLIKHRIGVSVNTESARYKELKADKAYLPIDWPEEEQKRLAVFTERAFEEYHACIKRLRKEGFTRKRAKETARYYLPYANQLTQDVSFNFRSFVHFIKLRDSEHAQKEVRELAQEMVRLVTATGQFDISLKAHGVIEDA